MTSAEELRLWLASGGYRVEKEEAVRSEGRVYTVMLVRWQEERCETSALFPYIGLLEQAQGEEARDYIRRELRHLENCIKGSRARGEKEKAQELTAVAARLKQLIEEEIP